MHRDDYIWCVSRWETDDFDRHPGNFNQSVHHMKRSLSALDKWCSMWPNWETDKQKGWMLATLKSATTKRLV